jgi:hypothetical protein
MRLESLWAARHLGADSRHKIIADFLAAIERRAATSRSRPARVAKFPVNCVNYLTLGSRKIWEPYFAKLNAATQRRYKCA